MYEDQGEGQPAYIKSFFTKRLEVKLEERGMNLPDDYIIIMDIPFEDFNESCQAFYDTEFKLYTYFFIEIIIDLYEALGAHREGWEEMLERLPECPIRELVELSLQEKARLENFDDGGFEEEPVDTLELSGPISVTIDKQKIKSYKPEEEHDAREGPLVGQESLLTFHIRTQPPRSRRIVTSMQQTFHQPCLTMPMKLSLFL